MTLQTAALGKQCNPTHMMTSRARSPLHARRDGSYSQHEKQDLNRQPASERSYMIPPAMQYYLMGHIPLRSCRIMLRSRTLPSGARARPVLISWLILFVLDASEIWKRKTDICRIIMSRLIPCILDAHVMFGKK